MRGPSMTLSAARSFRRNAAGVVASVAGAAAVFALLAVSHPPPGAAGSSAAAQATLRGNRALVIAHRGGAKESTENTIAAFQRAIRVGADGIETDLRLTRDGVIAIYHDERFGRVEGLAAQQLTRAVGEMTFAELSAQTLVPAGEDTGGRRVPSLGDVLAEVRRGLLNLEMKRGPRFDELVNQTIRALRAFPELDRVVLEPPDLDTAEKLRDALGPRIKLHVNPAYDGTVPFNESLARVLKFKPHSVSVSYKKVSLELVELAHRAGVEVWVWTVDLPEVAEAMRLLGVDAVKTDRPQMVVELFRKNAR
jgi:glycerophosphoryl diester phosphodiesterase